MMAVGPVELRRVPLLTLPGFHSISVLSMFAIFSAYQLHTIIFLCCTGGLAVRLVAIYTRKLVSQEHGENEKLSVRCSADSEDDPGRVDSSSQTKDVKDYILQHDDIRLGDESRTYGLLTQTMAIVLKTFEVNLKKFPNHEVHALLKKLKDPDACESSERMCKISEAAEENFNAVGKQPVEHFDVTCIAMQKNFTLCGTLEVSSHSSCAESGDQYTSYEPSDGSGTHGGQSCHGNKEQSGGGKSTNQGSHKKQKCSSWGTSTRDDDDEDGDDQQKNKHVEIPHGCQISSNVDVTMPEEDKPAVTSEEVAPVLLDRNQLETDVNENCTPNFEHASQTAGPESYVTEGDMSHETSEYTGTCQENVNQDWVANGSPGEINEEKVGQHQIADWSNMAAASGVQNSADLELESWNQILITTFQCQRNFGSKLGHCTEDACHKVQDLAAHCLDCVLHVFGGCLVCVKYCELLLYHVVRCHVPKCAHQCHFIKEYIQVHGTPDVERWSRALDKLFFKHVPPDYPNSQYTDQPLDRDSSIGCSRILVRGPVTATGTLSAGQGMQGSYKTQPRSKVQIVHWTLNKKKLSVTEDGRYDQDCEWFEQSYIGGGANGRCYQCTDIKTGFLFAIKKIRLCKFEARELEVWGSLSGHHPNIVELFGAIQTEEYVIIFMEFMKDGSVGDLFREDHLFNDHQALDVLRQVMLAVQFMHSKMILHRDIKGANVLLDDGTVKLADFGAAVRLTNKEFQQDRRPCGTEAFMAPEVCRSEDHSFSADVWSIMCLYYQLLTRQPPWQQYAHGSLLYKIGTAKEPPPLPPQCSAVVTDFFQRGFKIQPSERETVAALLRHQVFEPVALEDVSPTRNGVTASMSTVEDFLESSLSLLSDSPNLVSSLAGNEVEPEEEKILDVFGIADHVSAENPLSITERSAHICAEQLPPGERLSSLQSDLLLSLSQQSDNTNLFSSELPDPIETSEFDMTEFLDQLISCEQGVTQSTSLPAPDSNSAQSMSTGTYSMGDLTKVHILKPNGESLFMVRHNPSSTYGDLAAELHGSVAHLTGLDFFTLTLPGGTLLQVWEAIGSNEQHLKVEPAYDVDSWRGWRVDQYGLVEQRPCS